MGGLDGTDNTFVGYSAGKQDISGRNNVYLGAYAAGGVQGFTQNNTFIGAYSGYGNTENENTFVGNDTGITNDAIRNVFVGYRAGYKNVGGEKNTFLGHTAGRENTEASYNTFLGYEAGCETTSGDENTIVGAGAGYFNSNGAENVFVGRYAGQQNIDGSQNIFIGAHSALDNLQGKNNTFIGYNTIGSNVDSSHNQIVIGHNAVGQGQNMAVIGNSNITDIYMNQMGSGIIHANATIISSDKRLKTNINKLQNNLQIVNRLKPVQFQYINKPDHTRYGFIAQDVEAVIPSVVTKKETGYLGINYQDIIAILTGALQEQYEKTEALERQLESTNAILSEILVELKANKDVRSKGLNASSKD